MMELQEYVPHLSITKWSLDLALAMLETADEVGKAEDCGTGMLRESCMFDCGLEAWSRAHCVWAAVSSLHGSGKLCACARRGTSQEFASCFLIKTCRQLSKAAFK